MKTPPFPMTPEEPPRGSLVYLIPVSDVRAAAVRAGLRETDVIGISDLELLDVIERGFHGMRVEFDRDGVTSCEPKGKP